MSVYAVPRPRPSDGRQPRSRVISELTPDSSQTLTGIVLTVTPTLPVGSITQDAVVLGYQPLRGLVKKPTVITKTSRFFLTPAQDQTLTGVALTATPSLPTGRVDLTILGVNALSATPSLPTGTVTSEPYLFYLPIKGRAQKLTVTTKGSRFFTVSSLDQQITGVALTATPSLPTGQVDLTILGAALSVTPTLPVGTVDPGVVSTPNLLNRAKQANVLHRRRASRVAFELEPFTGDQTVTGVSALTVTPTLPIGSVIGEEVFLYPLMGEPQAVLTKRSVSRVITVPTASVADQTVTGVALSVTPTLPLGSVSSDNPQYFATRAAQPSKLSTKKLFGSRLFGPPASQTLTGAALSVTPTLPTGRVDLTILGVTALTVTPSLPVGTVAASNTITGVVLTITPTIPNTGRIDFGVLGTVLVITPTLPIGEIAGVTQVGCVDAEVLFLYQVSGAEVQAHDIASLEVGAHAVLNASTQAHLIDGIETQPHQIFTTAEC